jgi:hypothetical protein
MVMKRRGWHIKEEEFLIDNYAIMTIKELQSSLRELSKRDRTPDSINAKIKRLKAEGKIEGQKEEKAVYRSLIQRRKDYERKPGESM